MENESVEEKLDKLIALFNNLNMLAKLQTQKLNDFDKKLNLCNLQLSNHSNQKLNSIQNMPVDQPVDQPADQVDFPEAFIQEEKDKPTIVKITQENQPFQEEKKIIVQQKLFFQKTKSSIFGADVTIIDSKNQRLKTKSFPNGRWRISLVPGEYMVEISRPPIKDDPPIQNVSFSLSIKDSFKPIDLGEKYL